MSSPSPKLDDELTRPGSFNFLEDSVESSLLRNGKVLTKRDPDGSDDESVGVDLAPRKLEVCDARSLPGAQVKTCEANGFELLDSPLENDSLDFFDHEQVVRKYYLECEQIIGAHTGAKAYAFDHNIRSAIGKKSKRRITGGQQVQGPAHVVHGDYTLYSAPQRLRDLATPPSGNDTLLSVLPAGQSLISQDIVDKSLKDGGRFAIINLWRSIADETNCRRQRQQQRAQVS